MIKTILGYDIQPGVTPDEYERWLFEIHAPDIMANPYVGRIQFNKVLRPVTTTSSGGETADEPQSFYRIAEMHFENEQAYEEYLAWFASHPVAPERGPAGRTSFKFYVLAETTEVVRDGDQILVRAPVPIGKNVAGMVDEYLQLCEDRKLQEASRYLAADVRLEFPGGRVFTSLEEMAESSQGRYRWVRKHRGSYSSGDDDGTRTVTSIGTLYGERTDGSPFEGVRYVDFFRIRDGLIVEQIVWNDLAEMGIVA